MQVVSRGDKRRARSRKRRIRIAIHACALIILSATTFNPASAQQTARQPRFDARQIERTFDALQLERKRAQDAAVQLPRAARPEISADPTPLFKLTTVSVEGANVVSADLIAATYRPYIGKTVSQADLVAIAGQISDLYRDAGYHLSRAIVPPQEIKGGRIRVQVIAGRIADIVLKGERAEQFGAQPLLDPVTAENPSRLETLERQLLLVNDLPGVRIADTSIEEIGVASGRFRLIVYLETWRIYAALGLDNRGTPDVGPWQSYLASNLNSYFVKGDTLGLNLSTVPDTTRELGFGRLFYNAPIGATGARLGAVVLFSEIWPGDERRALATRTRTETYEVRGGVVPLRTRKSSLWLTAAAGYSNVTEKDSLGTNYRDHFRILGLTADYQLHDDLDGWNYLTLVARQGIDVLGASDKGDALLSRSDGSGNFSKLQFFYTRYQRLSDIWSLKISAAGQWASTALLASEEFYLGTAFGRGYYGADLSGDNGIAGSVELRFDQALKHDVFKGYQLYGFIDRGVTWNFRTGKDDALSLSLVGAGVRLFLADELQAGVEIAAPLEYRFLADQYRDPRVFFWLSKSFKLCPGSVHMRCS